jgi:Fe-S-cluster-containing dehydrogenase component
MKRWNMIVDVAKCHDCNNCFLACKDEYFENDYLPYSVSQPRHGHRWMDILRKEQGQFPKVHVAYLPYPCMHCDEAPCIDKSRGAIYKREDGIVIIDPGKARGKKEILKTCPYDVIYWNEEKKVPQKCTFCVHLLEDGWKEPRCVQSCPTVAMAFVQTEDSEMEKIKQSENLEVYRPEYKARPRVYYKNLHKYTKCFIAGSVALKDTDECAEGAKVTLRKESKKAAGEALTNNYGDFRIDNLEKESGKYRLVIQYPGHKKKELSVELKTSINLGTIFL